MRDLDIINLIIVHCSDSDIESHDDISVIKEWHINPKKLKGSNRFRYLGKTYNSINDLPESVRGKKGNGWSDVGYHYYIKKDGTVQKGRSLETIGSHAVGFNLRSIGICLGGKEGFYEEQFDALSDLIADLHNELGWLDVIGHCDVSTKTCPNFDVKKFLTKYGITA